MPNLPSKSKRKAKTPPGKDLWLKAARESLIQRGIGDVQIGKIARKLRVTRSTFYWFFSDREELHDRLIEDWELVNSAAFGAILQVECKTGIEKFLAMGEIWVDEKGFSSRWDSSMRDWARISTKVSAAVRRVDDLRVNIIKQVFLEMGCTESEALVRARIAYFHQVGYYLLGVDETRRQRLQLLPLYVRFLTGHSID